MVESIEQQTTQLLKGQHHIMALLDSQTALINTLDTNVLTIITEIQALKAANPTVDTTGLDAAIAKLQTDVTTAVADGAPASAQPPAPSPAPTTTS